MIVGTAGHIDHGKTTLVRALTGVDTDRLKEEKERGISIELGYAYVPLANGSVLGFIDVPGHEKLVHTMVAGACGIDFALLVVAADDGVMPQTREHMTIVGMLGIEHGAVALTKVDRVDEARRSEVMSEVRAWLAGTALATAPIFEVDATRDDDVGVLALNAHLHEQALAWQGRRDDGLFRLAIDRVFTLPGAGTIVTGTVFAGCVHIDDMLVLAPLGEPVRVRGIHAQHRAAAIGRAGERCALNLVGVEKERIARGDWIVDARLREASTRLDVELAIDADAGLRLRHWTPLHVHLGTLHRVAHAVLLGGGDHASRVQLVFDEPVCALTGDRFIVRNAQANCTVGGGRVLDPFGPARKRGGLERRAWLDALAQWVDTGCIDALVAKAPSGLRCSVIERLTGRDIGTIGMAEDVLMVSVKGAGEGEAYVVHRECWRRMHLQVIAALETFHARTPDEQGPDIARLRRIALPLVDDALWRALVDAMTAAGEITRSGPWLHLLGHTVSLDVDEQCLAERLLPLLRESGYEPRWVRELGATVDVPEERVRVTLRKLARQGEVYQVVHDLFYHREAVRTVAQLIAQTMRDGDGQLTAATFRDVTNLGRKRAIQVLEFFDRVAYTRFGRGVRRLRSDSRMFDGWLG
ncbi:selenocysteine-specific translation elongation factor [Trinickia fusca]|uniref:Selenocysteine-specific elongation factor n=1 Tax=Trinickia fusca TaxID=2419777 RepID=A0A494X830_9BURK|nr:selenocysteine-specific translation elongation factor [Trinickia fusca]RKP46432.1 selenocysteine-specific translation elongation factor [Trinickia fusca]